MNTNSFNLKTVAAIGKFDGFHIGHRELVHTAIQKALQKNAASLIYYVGSSSPCLMSENDAEALVTAMGADMCIRQMLTEEFKNLDAEAFVRDILAKRLHCVAVVVGYNFRFARGRCAGCDDLRRICNSYGIECIVIDEIRSRELDMTVSSTNIRTLLSEGRVDDAALLLSGYYSVCGTVGTGRQLGRTIGFPTANLELSAPYVLPKDGVYATRTHVGSNVYASLTNIGTNPTVSGKKVTVETHIIGFDDDIYDTPIRVEFVKRIRDEKKFDSLDVLKDQIQKDVRYAKEIIDKAI
ncbi:MAG: bifunctional riboflavin kinase/FAD synthetase [Clostridia bacterium]|nr:bifunctional riboflavin kinase/FAD synthetase [Clostridia bacterium]